MVLINFIRYSSAICYLTTCCFKGIHLLTYPALWPCRKGGDGIKSSPFSKFETEVC